MAEFRILRSGVQAARLYDFSDDAGIVTMKRTIRMSAIIAPWQPYLQGRSVRREQRKYMRDLTAERQRRAAEIGAHHGFSAEAAEAMLAALDRSGGTMAQFDHPEFGGSGQWMRGGMVMIGDMFNNTLKARVDALCNDLCTLPPPEPFGIGQGGMAGGNWWPAELGSPDATGSQNDSRYAWFGAARRRAIRDGGRTTVYDTGDHWISGVSQQQQNGIGGLVFTSQYGTVPVSSLPVAGMGSGSAAGSENPAESPAPSAPPVDTFEKAVPASPPPFVATATATTTDIAASSFTGLAWTYDDGSGATPERILLENAGTVDGPPSRRARYWSVEDGALMLFDADGLPVAHFDRLRREGSGLVATGTAGDGRGPAQTLRQEAGVPETPAAGLVLHLDLVATEWHFATADGEDLGHVLLGPDGRIVGSTRPSEALWRFDGDTLLFLHTSGRPTLRFDRFEYRAGRWTLRGAPVGRDVPGYVLTQG
jgi:hypothetical protein